MFTLLALVVGALLPPSGHASSPVRIGLTGDVNLNPFIYQSHPGEYDFPWGNTLATVKALDAFLINHEATIANVVDADPNNFQMEDPVNFTQTFAAAGVDVMSLANNHQFDYNRTGVHETLSMASKYSIGAAGVGYEDEVRKPLLLDVAGVPVALFTMVVLNCETDPKTGLDIPHTCTCGINETRSGMMRQQCYAATKEKQGQWFYDSISDANMHDIQSTISAFRVANPSTFVLTYLHVGPNFQWHPDSSRKALLRGIVDAGSDAVWGTSSHHVQGVEWWKGSPIIYGLGDFLFRHFPGITDYCPDYAVPCEQFRPELSVMHVLNLEAKTSGFRVAKIITHPTRHTTDQVFFADGDEDIDWVFNTLVELNKQLGGTAQVAKRADGKLTIAPHDPKQQQQQHHHHHHHHHEQEEKAALTAGASTFASTGNDRPIVGVLSQPLGVEAEGAASGGANNNTTRQTYIAASYIKFLEAAGARVVPIHYDASETELTELMGQINGLLFPGGGSDLKNSTRLGRAGKILYDLAVKANNAGDFFPLWGTCMGFQFMALLTTEDPSILCHGCYDSDGDPLPLAFAEPAASQSRLFADMTPELKHQLATENLTENSHDAGIAPPTFKINAKLASFYNVLSTNVDYAGKPFVSTYEAKSFPFYATQWHPEKNAFEWGGIGKLGEKAIPHGAHATAVTQFVANFFVGEARKSGHRFKTEAAEAAALIYNDMAVKGPNGYFEQVYLWPERPLA